ncbi:hypothetical protein GCM10009609_15130 [Pseudonocardia aurantiaca]|uniref:Uncharacterized protein n=1 Tax=Pseudonocardia aurantiaca TaxID=75290 RepID=A0ABW4FWX5_9PSEU
MAVVLGVAAAVLLVISAVLGPDQASPWLRAVYVLAQWTGPLLLIALGCLVLWQRVRPWATRRLVELAGPALIRAMPPRSVLEALLPWVYGDAVGHQEVVTGVLGGAGRDPAGRDTAISRGTAAYFRLWAVDERMYGMEQTWMHDFSGIRDNHKLVLFATSEPRIANLVASERTYPLFELWLLDDDDLEDFVPNLRATLEVGISYTDELGDLHRIPPRPLLGEEVALRQYDRYIRLPEDVDRQNLRIVEFDLYDLADPDHVVGSVESLAVRTINNNRNHGYLNWTPPHPCYVRNVTFDVRELALDGQKLVYTMLGSTIHKLRVPIRMQWVEVSDQIEISVDAWMLPGHAVTLLWRPVDGLGPDHASHP